MKETMVFPGHSISDFSSDACRESDLRYKKMFTLRSMLELNTTGFPCPGLQLHWEKFWWKIQDWDQNKGA